MIRNHCFYPQTGLLYIRTHSDVEDNDYVPESTLLFFSPYVTERCVSITIIDDERLEQVEGFSVTLESADDLNGRVVLVDSSKTIIVANDDG